jgi:hypothetical protein
VRKALSPNKPRLGEKSPWRLFQLLTALGVGLIVAVVVCYAGPCIAAITGGIGGFVTTLAVQASLWLRKFLAINAEQAV